MYKNYLFNQKGFSLLEILIAVGLIAVITSIGIPIYREYQKKAANTTVKAEANSMLKSLIACEMEYTIEQCMDPNIETNRTTNTDPDDDDEGPQFYNFFTKECALGVNDAPTESDSGKDNCYIQQDSRAVVGSGCVSAHRKAAGQYIHYCLRIEDGRVNIKESGKDRYCDDSGDCESI